MNQMYAMTQVCVINVDCNEIEKIVVQNLLSRGGDPSYDFELSHPIISWDAKHNLTVRFVQKAVFEESSARNLALESAPTKAEMDKLIEERRRDREDSNDTDCFQRGERCPGQASWL